MSRTRKHPPKPDRFTRRDRTAGHAKARRFERESRSDSEPAIVPSVLFDQETADRMNWKAVFGF